MSHGHGGYKELWASDGTANGTRSMGPYQVDQHKARIVNNQLVTIEDYGVFARELSIGHNYGNPIDTTGDGVSRDDDAVAKVRPTGN